MKSESAAWIFLNSNMNLQQSRFIPTFISNNLNQYHQILQKVQLRWGYFLPGGESGKGDRNKLTMFYYVPENMLIEGPWTVEHILEQIGEKFCAYVTGKYSFPGIPSTSIPSAIQLLSPTHQFLSRNHQFQASPPPKSPSISIRGTKSIRSMIV
jgi:hypothetical protein